MLKKLGLKPNDPRAAHIMKGLIDTKSNDDEEEEDEESETSDVEIASDMDFFEVLKRMNERV